MRSFDPPPGQTAPQLGSFIVARLIGSGTHTRVYLAWDTRSNQWIALRTLSRAAARDAEIRHRFETDANALLGLSHPHLLRVVSVEQLSPGGGDDTGAFPLVATDLAQAGTVYDWMDRNGPMGPRRAVALARKCGEGVAHLHQNGRVHGDLGPHRLLVKHSGIAVLADPGVSREVSPAFAAPERRAGGPLDPRADIFSLGATLVTMLTASLQADLSSLDLRDPRLEGVPDVLRPAIVRACRRAPEERYPSIIELVRALEQAAAPLPLDAEGPTLTDLVPALPSGPESIVPGPDLDDLVGIATPSALPRATPEPAASATPSSRTPARPQPRTPPAVTRTQTPAPRSPSPAPGPRAQTPPPAPPAKTPASASRRERSPAPAAPSSRKASRDRRSRAVGVLVLAGGGMMLALLLGLVALGFAVRWEVRADHEATEICDTTLRALVLDVDSSAAVVEELASLGGAEDQLNAAWQAFNDANGDDRGPPAAAFAALAAAEGSRLELSGPLRTRVMHIDRLRKEWDAARAHRDELRSSRLGAVVGFFLGVSLYTPSETP